MEERNVIIIYENSAKIKKKQGKERIDYSELFDPNKFFVPAEIFISEKIGW